MYRAGGLGGGGGVEFEAIACNCKGVEAMTVFENL